MALQEAHLKVDKISIPVAKALYLSCPADRNTKVKAGKFQNKGEALDGSCGLRVRQAHINTAVKAGTAKHTSITGVSMRNAPQKLRCQVVCATKCKECCKDAQCAVCYFFNVC
eukprot:1161184-Pelagomonas_calceolata.AAC.5